MPGDAGTRTDTTPTPEGVGGPAQPASVLDSSVGRMLVQGVGLISVAAIVLALLDERSEDTTARLDALEAELDEVRRQRDRMQRLSADLTEALDEASVETEIVRWQLAYTEERLARARSTARADLQLRPPTAARDRTSPPEQVRRPVPATFVSLDPSHAPPPDARHPDPLEDELAVLALADDSILEELLSERPSVEHRPSRPSSAVHLELEAFTGSQTPTDLRAVGSQLDRDRAFAMWDGLVDEAAAGECSRRMSANARRCRDRVRRRLMPWGSQAVECMLSGNASADYVSGLRLDQLPTHSVPLDEGAVILCDGGLQNLETAPLSVYQ